MENALDADAGAITVDLRDGGAALVRVTDDGHGMSAEELPIALERHATSKLARDDDLDAIATLGFRGEALAAIGAVSRFTVTSCARRSTKGCCWPGGRRGPPGARRGPPDGTTVEVAGPVLQHARAVEVPQAPPTEVAPSLRILHGIALAHHGVQLSRGDDGRAALTAPAASDAPPPRRRLLGFSDSPASCWRWTAGSTAWALPAGRAAPARARQP